MYLLNVSVEKSPFGILMLPQSREKDKPPSSSFVLCCDCHADFCEFFCISLILFFFVKVRKKLVSGHLLCSVMKKFSFHGSNRGNTMGGEGFISNSIFPI